MLCALPELFVVHPTDPAATWMRASVDYALAASRSAPHAAPVVDPRLSELLFTEVLRLYLGESRDTELVGWLAALRDPVVGPALGLLHEDPARDWTWPTWRRPSSRPKRSWSTVSGNSWDAARCATSPSGGSTSPPACSVPPGAPSVRSRRRWVNTSEQAFSRAFKHALGQAPTRWRAAGESGDEPPPTRASPTKK